MNFFGHAIVACWRSTDPGFVLGAMLPDFASMVGTRIAHVHDARLAEGVALHHRTDAAFHRAETFTSLCNRGRRELSRLGLPRGSARAVAHVGLELLLDGLLLRDRGAGPKRRAYREALAAAHDDALGACITWRADDGAERFRRLRGRLLAHSIPDGYACPERVAERLDRALAGRQALSIPSRNYGTVVHWLARTRPHLASLTGRLFEEVERGLAPHGGPGAGSDRPEDARRLG